MDKDDFKEGTERAEKVKRWLKNQHNFLFFLLIAFTIAIKLYYFFLASGQPLWWDEGDYLAMATHFAQPFPETPEWWGHFAGMRPPLMPLVWALLIKLNFSEPLMRFITEVIPSILLVLFTYLFASSLFNKRIGLVAGYSMAIYWVIQFYGLRFLTDIPVLLFSLMCLYYFWEFYINRGQSKGLYLGVLFGVLAFLTRFPAALVILSIVLFLLITKKQEIIKEKLTWKAIILGLVLLIPFFIYNKIMLGGWFPAGTFYLTDNTITYSSFAWYLIGYISSFLKLVPTLILSLGFLLSLFKLVLGWDIVLKQKSKHLNNHLFLFLLIIVQIIFYVFIFKTGNDRWILMWMPLVFIYLGLGIEAIAQPIKKYFKFAPIVLIILVLGLLSFTFMPHADQLIKVKVTSYSDVKDTSLWLKYNSPEDAKILCASIVQTAYYAQRRTYDFYTGTELRVQVNNTMVDAEGKIMSTAIQSLRNETELECKIARIKPDYMVLHVWEPEFTPQFMYDYAQRNPLLLQPVQAFQTNGQTTAVVYKFNSYPEIDAKKVNCSWVYERPDTINRRTLAQTAPERLIIPK
ncbi:glycosyltransferase family 39 protein [Candidatus Pacearchaeota archaeon]|nr:glycosyltransferase family 39 protein [Candidatus Pacearchaeota archaeon]